MIKYLFFLIILLIPLGIDQAFAFTYNQVVTTDARSDTTFAGGVSCPVGYDTSSGTPEIRAPDSAIALRCWTAGFDWDVSSLPDSFTDIVSIQIEYDITAIASPTNNCRWKASNATLPSATAMQNALNQGGSDTDILGYADSNCITVGDNKIFTLNSNATEQLLKDVVTDEVFTIVGFFEPQTRDGTTRSVTFRANDARLIIIYDHIDAVDDLTAVAVRGTAVDLDWTTPNSNTTITGYQINFTTPHNKNVASVAEADTGSTSTAATVNDLTGLTNYTFRVKALPDGNASGNIVNITTAFDPTASFTAGTFNITQTGTDIRNFKFERIDINDTALRLNVTYSNAFDVDCNFYYKFAMTNDTFTSIADTAISTSEDEASFLFLDVDNEIIDVACIDKITATNGTYLITQTNFPILDQIADFRAGEFGTDGNFGVIDFITLAVILISMIGFNQVNPSVGVIFSVIIIGAFSVFGVIPWESTFTASTALVIMWAITTTRKQ